MKSTFSRRTLLRSSALAAAASAAFVRTAQTRDRRAFARSPGHRSYTFRNFTRAQMIPWLKQLHIAELNARTRRIICPRIRSREQAAVDDYKANGIHLHAAGAIYFRKDEDDDIRAQFEYVKRAGIPGDRGGRSRAGDAAAHREVREGIRHPHRDSQSRAGGQDVSVARSTSQGHQGLDPRMGCCIDVGTRRARAPTSSRRSTPLGRGSSTCTSRTWPASRTRKARSPSARARCRSARSLRR